METIPMDVGEQHTPGFLIHAYCSCSLSGLHQSSQNACH